MPSNSKTMISHLQIRCASRRRHSEKVLWFVAFVFFAATGSAQTSKQLDPADVPSQIVDWTPGSAWMQTFEKRGEKATDKPAEKTTPAYSRDQMKVRALAARKEKRTSSTFEPSPNVAFRGSLLALGRGEQSTPLIEEIAFGLDYDPLRIFNWVRTQVEYFPYFGLWQGAHVTALELQGNDYDQCVLLVSLLKQAGGVTEITYKRGNMTYSEAEISSWLNWSGLDRVSGNFTAFGISNTYSGSSISMDRVVVQARIDGVLYLLDPAFKKSTRAAPVAVATVHPGYSAAGITATAGGSIPSDDQVSGIAVDGFQNSLGDASTAYVRSAALNYAGRDPRSLLGIPVLDESDLPALPSQPSQSFSISETWTEIPDDKLAKLRLTFGSWTTELNWPDLADDNLNVRFASDGRASLYRNDVVIGSEAGTFAAGSLLSIPLGMVYPQQPSTVTPLASSTAAPRAGVSYILPSSFGSRGRLKQAIRVQAEAASANVGSVDSNIRTLAVLGLQRAVHSDNLMAVIGAQTEKTVFDFGSVWFYHARGSSWWVDGPASVTQVRGIRPNSVEFMPVFDAVIAFASATEHLTLEQMTPSAAASTMAVFESALRSGKSILRLRPENWNSMMGLIQGGTSGVLPGVYEHVVTNSKRAFVPNQLDIPIYGGSGLTGKAALHMARSLPSPNQNWWLAGGHYISGNYLGGGTNNAGSSPTILATNTAKQKADETKDGASQTTGADPVDLFTGAFLYEAPGLSLGSGAEPAGLNLRHFYSSSQRLHDTAGVAPGWTHSYDLVMRVRHANDVDLRTATVAEVAPLIVASRYLQDVITGDPTAKEIALRALTVNWAARQFLNSKATVALGERRMEFHRLADGSYIQSSSVPATLAKQSDGSHLLEFRNSNKFSFRASDSRATSIKDTYNNELTLTYNGSNQLYQVRDRYFRTLTFNYSGAALVSVMDSTGRTVNYVRSPTFGITGPDSGTMSFESDAGRITRVIDARSRTVVFNYYDQFQRVTKQEPFGDPARTTLLGYAPGLTRESAAEIATLRPQSWTSFDPKGRRIAFLDAVGNRQTWAYDGIDRMVKHVTPRGGISTMTYDPYHVLVGQTTPAGSRTIIPDALHRPSSVNDLLGQATVFTYTAQHAVETITAPGGLVTRSTYDATGRLTGIRAPADTTYTIFSNFDAYGNAQTVTHPDSRTSTFLFNARGDLTQAIDRRSVKTTYEYNNRRLRTKAHQWEGTVARTTETAYDATGDVDYVLDPLGRKTDSDFDALGHLLTVKGGAGQVTVLTNTYDVRNQLWQTTDANSHTAELGYDAAGRMAWAKDARGHRTDFTYDADGNRTDSVSPLLNDVTDTFDLAGRRTGWQDPLDANVIYGYDANGRMTSLLNRRSQTFSWTYNDAARTATATTPTGKITSTAHNTRGLTTTVTEPSTQVTNLTAFDAEGRPTAMNDGVGSTAMTYWENGLLKETTETINGTARTIYRSYDALNRLNEYRDGEGSTLRYTYHPDGRLWELTYPDNRKVTYVYDDFGRLRTVSDWSNRVTTYTYDNASRLTLVERPNGTTRHLVYTADDRLERITEKRADGSVLWFQGFTQIDADGRITQRFLSPAPQAVTVPVDSMSFDADNRVDMFNGGTVTHDDDGNMTTGPDANGTSASYGYDARNRLITHGGSNYRYNADGLRVEITGPEAATFAVDPNAALTRTLSRTKGGVTTYYVYGLDLLYEETGGVTTTYHSDHLGSTVALTAQDGNTVTDRVEYAPYGAITLRTGSTDTPFLWHGALGVMRETNGLYYMRARFYNPRLMRFLNADPIGFGGGLNHYAFCGNNPISFTDPWGLERKAAMEGGMMARFVVTPRRTAGDIADSVRGRAIGEYLAMSAAVSDPVSIVVVPAATGVSQGAGVWFDRVIPFWDPFADSFQSYDPLDPDLQASQFLGAMGQNATTPWGSLRGLAQVSIWSKGTVVGKWFSQGRFWRIGGSGGAQIPTLRIGAARPPTPWNHIDLRLFGRGP